MNLTYWGVPIPTTDSVNGPATALPVMDVGPMALAHVAGTQTIAITDAADISLTIPTDAVYAKVQFNGGAAWYSTTATAIVIANGNAYKVADLTIVELFGYDQISKFRARAHTGASGKVYVEYKKYIKDNKA